MSKIIPNTNGRYSITNDGIITDNVKRFELSHSNHNGGYKCVSLIMSDNKRKVKLIHRLIAQCFIDNYDEDLLVDHRDGCRTNNNIENLRMVNAKQNMMNTNKRTGTYSEFKGVSFDMRRKKWYSQIHNNGTHIFIAYHENEIAAAMAYNTAAIRLFGEFAKLNDFLPFSE